jgi:hypothetical protein
LLPEDGYDVGDTLLSEGAANTEVTAATESAMPKMMGNTDPNGRWSFCILNFL